MLQISDPKDFEIIINSLNQEQKACYIYLKNEIIRLAKPISASPSGKTIKQIIETLTPLQKEAIYFEFETIIDGEN